MEKRLEGKTVLLIGGGQTPGRDLGNGRAAGLLYGRHGGRIAVVDRDLGSAEETVGMITDEGGDAFALRADVSMEDDLRLAIASCYDRCGRIDVLHYNVGVAKAGGDAPIAELEAAVFDRLMAINVRGLVLTTRHVLPIMRAQLSGVIVAISSVAANINYPSATYRISKSAMITAVKHTAITNAEYGIRANAILPGLITTPMAIESRVAIDGVSREALLASRQARIPLRNRTGSAWDVASAALFLASDDASFITGAELVVDGGQSLLIG